MNQTSIHHPDNVLTQINAFYWFHITQKQFLSCLSRSKDKCHFYRLFSVNIRRTFLVNLTSIFHTNNVLNQSNLFYWFNMKQLKHFLSCRTCSEVSMESFDYTSYAFLMLWRRMRPTAIIFFSVFHRSIDRMRSPFSLNRKVHWFENTEQHLVDLFLARCERMFCGFQPMWR